MNKTLKKTLSIILAILMIVTSVPFAFAAEGDVVMLELDGTTTYHGTLQDAFEAGKTGTADAPAKITLLQSAEESVIVDNSGVYILELNGKSISSNSYTLILKGDMVVTIKDSVGDGGITATNMVIAMTDSVELTILSGTITGDIVNFAGWKNEATLNIEGGTFNDESYNVSAAAKYINISGGEFNSYRCIYIHSWNSVKVTGSPVFKATREHFYFNGGTLDLSEHSFDKYYFIQYAESTLILPKCYGIKDNAIAKNSHTFTDSNKCDVCGDECEHSWELGVCTLCKYVCEHDWSNKDGICTNSCGYECPHESYTDCKCDVCGYECPHESYTDGKCDACEVARADYTAFDAAVNELSELINHDRLLTNWKETYTENKRVYVNFVGNNRTEREQNVVDNVTNTLNNLLIASLKNNIENGSAIRADFTYMKSMIDQINALIDNEPNNIIDSATDNYDGPTSYYNGNKYRQDLSQASYESAMEEYHYEAQLESLLAGLKDGTMKKADYTEIDEAIKAVDEALENATISEEMANELSDIKAQLETLKADSNTSAADLTNSGLLDRAEAITETINNCANGVHSFTCYTESEAARCGENAKETASCDNGCGATDTIEVEGTMLEHEDENGDYLCDHDCGYEFEKPAEPEEPTEDVCEDCGKVHTNFFSEIICFFIRIFNFIKNLFA